MNRLQGKTVTNEAPTMTKTKLTPDQLCRRTDPETFSFETTADLPVPANHLGQERAVEAIEFGIAMKRPGYSMYVLGRPGAGKHRFAREYLETQATSDPVPDDWCYVYNFDDPHQPRALNLPAGTGRAFEADMRQLVDELKVALPAAFESDDYRARNEAIETEMQERRENAVAELQEEAEAGQMALIRTPMGLAVAPIKDGDVISADDFNALPEAEQERRKQGLEDMQAKLQATMRSMPLIAKEQGQRQRDLNRETARFTVEQLITDVTEQYADFPDVLAYLDDAQEHMVEHADRFLGGEKQEGVPALGAKSAGSEFDHDPFHVYRVNVIVEHGDEDGAPVVYESLPNHGNLIGRIESLADFGTLVTDFTLIKPGALHRANGGYLILDAVKVLSQTFAWEELKRTIKSREIRIESLAQALSLTSTATLKPEAIPLEVKVILIGERMLYYLLSAYDPEFSELFKVAVDFEDDMDRTADASEEYARFLGELARSEGLRPLDPSAVARVEDRSARLADDAEKLTCINEVVADLLAEADYWAADADSAVVTGEHVQKAIAHQIRRADRMRDQSQEAILRGTLLVDTEGSEVGQVNGLSVLQLGGFSFGKPSRITARVRLGKGDVVDIEREVDLGGPLHSKGVLILAGFLGGRYAADQPLSLRATLVFEQSYGGVDGDSASSAELYALLSALSGVPIRQSLPVTGSVNQLGQVQAIGGVNEKIEGFFDICRERGLSGEQGVVIPASNIKHLMLRDDVVEAVTAGTFHIHAVETIDEGIEALTGVEAGAADETGTFSKGSVNRRVQDRLRELAAAVRAFTGRGQTGVTDDDAPEPGKAEA